MSRYAKVLILRTELDPAGEVLSDWGWDFWTVTSTERGRNNSKFLARSSPHIFIHPQGQTRTIYHTYGIGSETGLIAGASVWASEGILDSPSGLFNNISLSPPSFPNDGVNSSTGDRSPNQVSSGFDDGVGSGTGTKVGSRVGALTNQTSSS
jgi:hypothetical protein